MPQYLVRQINTQDVKYAFSTSLVDPNFLGPVSDENPAPPLEPDCEPGCELILWAGKWSEVPPPPSPTARLRWDGTDPVWIEEGQMRALIADALQICYTDIDKVTQDAVGSRAQEYLAAEAAARAFEAAGYTGPVSSYVSAYAADNETNTQQTNEWAAKSIISRANAFALAQEAMRAKRFNFQRAMRNSVTPAELAHVIWLWDQFIIGLRAQLGL